MKLETKFLIVAVLAIALAVPVTFALQHRNHQLKAEKSQNTKLQLQLNAVQKDLQLKSSQIQTKEQQIQEQQKANDDLKAQLQSKRTTPATTASQAQSAPVAAVGCDAYRGIVAQYDWNVNTAMAIMRAESNCNSMARSPTHDSGLFQINDVHLAAVDYNQPALYDPATNVKVAYQVYSGSGWNAWTTFTSGAYTRFL